MSFPNAPGVYDEIVDRTFSVDLGGIISAGIVISATRGPVTPVVITGGTREFFETFGLPSRDNPSAYAAVRFLRSGGILTVVRAINDAEVASGGLSDVGYSITVTANGPGVWGNSIELSFEEDADLPDGVFRAIIKEADEIVEIYEVSQSEDAKDGFGKSLFIDEVINRNSKRVRVESEPWLGEFPLDTPIELTGGSDDTVAPTSGMLMTAWDLFKNKEEVDATFLINAGFAAPEVQIRMMEVASDRRTSMALLDVPFDTADDVQAMVDYRKTDLGVSTFYGALYGGWVRIYDQYTDRDVFVPPSGDVAAKLVETLQNGNRWDAAAGLQNGVINASGVTKMFSENELAILYSAGINPVTRYAGVNCVIWGQKTLQKEKSALDRINVVTNVLWINDRIVDALQPFVFQPNTTFVRDSINFLITSFLENVERRGGLYGFKVDTGPGINTPFIIDQNQMYVDVYIQPTRTAEFIKVRSIVTPTGVTLA